MDGNSVSKGKKPSIKQGNTVLNPEGNWRTATECRKYRCVVCSISSHVLMGHGDKALTSISMLPQCNKNFGGWSTLGLRQWKTISTTLARHAPLHQEVAVQGFERRWQQKTASLIMAKVWKKNLAPQTTPTVAPRPQEGRWRFSGHRKQCSKKR